MLGATHLQVMHIGSHACSSRRVSFRIACFLPGYARMPPLLSGMLKGPEKLYVINMEPPRTARAGAASPTGLSPWLTNSMTPCFELIAPNVMSLSMIQSL